MVTGLVGNNTVTSVLQYKAAFTRQRSLQNREMCAYSEAAFWLFTRHRFVWNVGVAFLGEHAVIRLYARTKAKEETLC